MTACPVEATPAIATAGLTKRFGRVQAVTNVSLEIPAGRVFGLLGPNGSGKTTLLSMLAGFIAPAAGEITLLGRSGPAGLRESRRSIGALIERPIFWPYLSCRNNLKCLQGLYHSPGGETELSRLLETAGLAGDAERRKFANCSTGMKARLGIAAALLGDPDVLILDEPTNGLDPVGIVEVRDLINSLCAGGQRTIVLASHLLNEVEQVCDSVGIMRRGQLLFSGPVSELRGPPLVTVRTTDANRAATLLRDGGWDVRLPHGDGPGGGLEVTATPGREWEITRLLAGVGVYVSEMRSGSGSLEAGFMEVAGGDADQP